MISVRTDVVHQRIDLKIDQQVQEADVQRVLSDLKEGVRKMRPGWTMASDLRGLIVVHPAHNHYIVEIQKTVAEASPGKFATLVDSHVLKLQLRVDSKAAQATESIRRFDDYQQWLSFLAPRPAPTLR